MSGLEHYDNEIFAVEARVGRLAIACGVDVSNERHVAAAKSGDFSFCTNGDAHTHRMLQELLQLLDYITLHCVNERGMAECPKTIEDVETRLRLHQDDR